MSPNIPFEIQAEIIQYLPLKSLLRFRIVSKSWKSLIHSSNFISSYTIRHLNQPHHLLVAYRNSSSQSSYISIADDDSFPQNKFSATLPAIIRNSILVGSSHGLICLCICPENPFRFVLWNPSIRKSIPIPIPSPIPLATAVESATGTAFGFGVCPATRIPKLIIIDNNISASIFSLSSGVWRISSANLPSQSVQFDWCYSQVTVDRFAYWFAVADDDDDGYVKRNMVISFDLSSEAFEQIPLPDNLHVNSMYLCKRNDSLAVVTEDERGVLEVWVIQDGDSKTFTKLFAVKIPWAYMSSFPIGFNRNDEILMVISEASLLETEPSSRFVVCKPSLECIEDVDIEIEGELESINMCLYTKSLLLLDL